MSCVGGSKDTICSRDTNTPVDSTMLIPVVLSGGSGSRLWPLSRAKYPKQFLSLVDEGTMFQQTLTRLIGFPGLGQPMVICNDEHRFVVGEQLQAIGVAPLLVLLEPAGRGTAPAVALAALSAIRPDFDPVLVVMPSDHVVDNEPSFHRALRDAAALAETGCLATFGINPTAPETGYGYIRTGEAFETGFRVKAFVEKPDAQTAQDYLNNGNYLWNSGMFVFRASRYLAELRKFAPEILSACERAIGHSVSDLDFTRPDRDAFLACPSDSVDCAVMENTADAVVVRLDAGWSDVGTWDALWSVDNHDEHNNVVHGDVLLHETQNSYVRGESRLVATIGVKDAIIIETADAVLVADKHRAQDVKSIVQSLLSSDRYEALSHRTVYRPWGHYDSIVEEERFQVKRISVKPGGKLSLQMHHHRSEHWVVVKGTARVTNGDQNLLLAENESTYIPIGTRHRLENPGTIFLEVIEVQSGSHLGEDDIVRFDDVYGRTEERL